MTSIVNINGEIKDPASACISVLDRGFLYGDSVYEVVRTYNGRFFALGEHLDRLARSAQRLDIPLPKRALMIEQLEQTLGAAQNAESYCRIVVTRGSGPITLDPTEAVAPAMVIIVTPYQSFPEWMYTKGVSLVIPSVRRTSKEALDPAIKSGNHLNSILALGEARKQGYDDAVLLDKHGHVTESTSSNVFVVEGGVLLTPSLASGLLAGVTRSIILELAAKNEIPCQEQQISTETLIGAEEVMLTSTLKEVVPVAQINGQRIGDGQPGPVAKRLRQLLRAYVIQSVS